LNKALDSLIKIQKEVSFNLKLPERTYHYLKAAVETLNMLKLGELLTRASLLRTESKGVHYRKDYPSKMTRIG